MKKIIIALLIGSNLLALNIVSAQKKGKSFTGNITFSIKYEGNIDPQKINQMPTKKINSVFENNVRESIPGQPTYDLTLGDSCKQIILVDYPGYQFAIVRDRTSITENRENVNFSYTKTGNTKNICGFVCNEINCTIISTDEDGETEEEHILFYTTTEIGTSNAINEIYRPGLEGFPLYVEMTSAQGIKTIVEATEVKKAKVSIVDFMIPTSYKVLTWAEYIELMQQQQDEDDF